MHQRLAMAGTLLTASFFLLAACGCSREDVEEARASSGRQKSADSLTTSSEDKGRDENKTYRGRLGDGSRKVRTEDGRTYLWAGGDESGPGSQWYEFTGASIPASDLQFGIGKDKIPSIDDPLFVKPDDPRLLALPRSPYRPNERPTTTDEIRVIGHVENGEARAYPIALLDQHELVNDRIGGKPVTVGW